MVKRSLQDSEHVFTSKTTMAEYYMKSVLKRKHFKDYLKTVSTWNTRHAPVIFFLHHKQIVLFQLVLHQVFFQPQSSILKEEKRSFINKYRFLPITVYKVILMCKSTVLSLVYVLATQSKEQQQAQAHKALFSSENGPAAVITQAQGRIQDFNVFPSPCKILNTRHKKNWPKRTYQGTNPANLLSNSFLSDVRWNGTLEFFYFVCAYPCFVFSCACAWWCSCACVAIEKPGFKSLSLFMGKVVVIH